MLTPPLSYSRRSRNIVILDLRIVNLSLLAVLQPELAKHRLQSFEEDVFDYCICRSLQNLLDMTVRGRILNLPQHDLYRVIYDTVQLDFEKAMAYVLSNYRIKFLPKATVKLLSTFEELIVVEYFQT